MNYRSRPLLDAIASLPCQVRAVECSGQDTVVAAHSNAQNHGKGMAIKAHDCFAVACCANCHRWLDHGNASREEKQIVWQSAYWRTMRELFERGLIEVSEQGRLAA